MKIEEVIKTYGAVDYYDMPTGRIFKISQATYNPTTNKSTIPVSCDGDIIGTVSVDGDVRQM